MKGSEQKSVKGRQIYLYCPKCKSQTLKIVSRDREKYLQSHRCTICGDQIIETIKGEICIVQDLYNDLHNQLQGEGLNDQAGG